jgi:hypothetical protein
MSRFICKKEFGVISKAGKGFSPKTRIALTLKYNHHEHHRIQQNVAIAASAVLLKRKHP